MTLQELEYTYNFHDCDVFVPFEIDGDSIIVIFDLAKHLQYEPLKSRYGDLLKIKDNNLIVRAKFTNCLNIQVNEWEYCISKNTKREEKRNEKTISMENFDSDMDFISLTVFDENKISFVFEKHENRQKLSRIQFICNDVDIVEEKIYTASEYDELWKGFEFIDRS